MTIATEQDEPLPGAARDLRSELRATRREWLGLAVIALPCLLYAMDLTVLNLALPTLSRELKPSGTELLWIVDIYGFMVSGFLITMGTLGDRIGRRKLLLIGAAAFGAASLLAAFARTPAMLIAMRAVLGVAGATVAPSTLSLIRNMFRDDGERRVAIGVWVASYSVGGAIGPLVGGVLLEHFVWSAIFLAALPVMLLLLVLGPWLLPEYRAEQGGPLDLVSSLLSLSAVLAVVYGLKRLAEEGLSPLPVLSLSLGIALGVAFVRRQRTLPDPLIDLSLFRLPAFTAPLAGYGLGCFTMTGVGIFLGQYLQLVAGLSPFQAGLWMVPWAGGFVVGSLAAPRLGRHLPVARAIAGGLLVAAAGTGLLTQIAGPYGLISMAVGTVCMSLGMSPLFTLGNDLIVGNAPPERAGAAAAISETSAELSAALGIALFGSLGAAIYRRVLHDRLPDGLSSEVVHEVTSTVGRALAAVDPLAPALASGVRAAATHAFTVSLQVIAMVCSVLVLLAAVYEGRKLRSVQ